MCGEKSFHKYTRIHVPGSPPHVRGKVRNSIRKCTIIRITPACAGKRSRNARKGVHRKDHPRMCGEKSGSISYLFVVGGSPPHVRGKVGSIQPLIAKVGITPACAGKSLQNEYTCQEVRDHPRMCGEKKYSSIFRRIHTGSPPHVRGKDLKTSTRSLRSGITPACAGKRNTIPCTSTASRDHPRMCGEKIEQIWPYGHSEGSPPHVRGKADTRPIRYSGIGITPACAGKSH